jgi:hypothetical protein
MPSWLAVSTWSGRRSRFGTAASFEGIHMLAALPTRKLPTSSHHGALTKAMDSRKPQRSRSATIMTLRRSNRSASSPPTGANSSPGARPVSTTPTNAKFWAK